MTYITILLTTYFFPSFVTHSHFDYISVNGSDFAKGKPSQSPTRRVIAKTRFSGLIIVYSFLLVSFRFLFSNQVAKLKMPNLNIERA